jgi:hypothetical protein
VRRLLGILLAGGLALVGCSDSDDDDEAATTTRDTTTTTAAASSTTTTTAATTTTCGEPAPPPALDGTEARVLGRLDISGDGRPEIFAVVGSGASVSIVGVFGVDGCATVPVEDPAGGPFDVAVGGTVTHLDGARCESDGVTVLLATSDDGVTYRTRDERFTFVDGVLRPVAPPAEGTVDGDDPALGAYAVLSCPGIENP